MKRHKKAEQVPFKIITNIHSDYIDDDDNDDDDDVNDNAWQYNKRKKTQKMVWEIKNYFPNSVLNLILCGGSQKNKTKKKRNKNQNKHYTG